MHITEAFEIRKADVREHSRQPLREGEAGTLVMQNRDFARRWVH
jgi:hypothetical protein